MKHLAAYLLLSLNGGSPSESDVKKLLSSFGIEADESRLEKLFAELKGKDINELIQEGSAKLSSVPSGGGGGGGGAVAAGGAAAAPDETPKEEEKEEEKEESDEDMGFGLFD